MRDLNSRLLTLAVVVMLTLSACVPREGVPSRSVTVRDPVATSGVTDAATGPQIKALGRELAERIILERVVDGIVQLAA